MSTQFAVDLIFKSKGVSELNKLSGSTEKVSRAARKAQGNIDGASNSVRRFDRSARSAKGGVTSLIGTLGKLAVAYGAVSLAQKALQAGRDYFLM